MRMVRLSTGFAMLQYKQCWDYISRGLIMHSTSGRLHYIYKENMVYVDNTFMRARGMFVNVSILLNAIVANLYSRIVFDNNNWIKF